jgi:seryl-tRNA synthetase
LFTLPDGFYCTEGTKKAPIWLFLDKFEIITLFWGQLPMLSIDQIQQLITENESLQVQVNDLNYILSEREEEIAELKKTASAAAELRSMLDTQLDDMQLMQNHIGKQQRQAMGAEERELELQQELTQAIKLQHQYNDLFQQYTYITTQLSDVQEELTTVKKRSSMLQKIAVQIGEMESTVENLILERDALKDRLLLLEKEQSV